MGQWIKSCKDFPPSLMTSVQVPHDSCKLFSDHHTEAMTGALVYTHNKYKQNEARKQKRKGTGDRRAG